MTYPAVLTSELLGPVDGPHRSFARSGDALHCTCEEICKKRHLWIRRGSYPVARPTVAEQSRTRGNA